jgi:signal transduction histidine kinase
MKKHIWLYLACATVIGLFIWAGISFNERLSALKAAEDITIHTYQVITQLRGIENTLLEAETGERGFLLTGDSSYLQSYLASKATIFNSLDSIKRLVNDNQEQVANTAILKASIALRFEYLFQTLEKKQIGDLKGLKQKLDLGKRTMKDYRMEMKNMRDIELGLLEKRKMRKQEHELLTPAMFRIIFLMTGFFLLASMIAMINELRKRINYQKELEDKVMALNINNEELEQFVFAASHNLQEPLRKIRSFSSLLVHKQKDKLDEESELIVERMDLSAVQFQGLLTDLVSFTDLIQNKSIAKPIDLNHLLSNIANDTAEKFGDIVSKIDIAHLPKIIGVSEQLQILFSQLFDNSILYRSPERPLVISITSVKVRMRLKSNKEYHKISFTDNGSGFENAYKDKIFKLFQRLDNDITASQNKGVGLAICKKIMLNHHGFIDADGFKGKGATIFLYFPKI